MTRLFLATLFLLSTASAQLYPRDADIVPNRDARPPILEKVSIEQRPDAQIPLQLVFRDESGASVELAKYFGSKPIILTLVYYECPMLCGEVLSGLTRALRVLNFSAGKEFDVVTISIDPRETPQLAADKKAVFLRRYGRAGADQGWHFLTGNQPEIAAITKAAGFNYTYDEKTGQFAHAAAIMLLTPEGRIARYFYGVEYAPKDLRLGLIEASANKIGSLADQLLLYCFHYDPQTGRYNAVIANLIRLSGVVTTLLVGAFLLVMFRRERKRQSVMRI
jgi:protein SCO1